MAKVKKGAYISVNKPYTTLTTDVEYKITSGDHQIYSNNFDGVAWEYAIFAEYYATTTKVNATFKANIGSNNISESFTTPATAYQYDYVAYSIIKSTNSTENLTVKINHTDSINSKFKVTDLKIALSSIFIPWTTGITWKPRELKQLWELASATLFWLDTNWDIYDWIYDSWKINSFLRFISNTPLSSWTETWTLNIPNDANLFVYWVYCSWWQATWQWWNVTIIPLWLIKERNILSENDTGSTYSARARYDSTNNKIIIDRYQNYTNIYWKFF